MTSEQNVFSLNKYSHFQRNVPDSFPTRKPTEGEIDQFIELLKHSNNQVTDENNQITTEPCSSQHGDFYLKSDVSIDVRKQNSFSNVENCESSSRVTFSTDGTLIKTIHVQSPESFIKEAERFEQEFPSKRDLEFRDKSFRSSNNRTSSPSTSDYLRKTTFLNKNSELKVTISRDQDKVFNQGHLKEEMNSRGDIDKRMLNEETMYSNKTFSDIYSRNYSLARERSPDSFVGTSSHGRLSNTIVQEKKNVDGDFDMRIPAKRSPPMSSQRRSYSGDRRNLCDRSLLPYQEQYTTKVRDDSPFHTNYHHGNVHERSPGFSSITQWRHSPTITGSSKGKLISADKDIYNPQEEDSFSDFDVRGNSPELKEVRQDEKRFGRRKPSPLKVPSPPPPPVLSDMKKQKTKNKSGYDHYIVKNIEQKSSVNPISTLLADRNVSISSLLEAAIGTSVNCTMEYNGTPLAIQCNN